MAPDLAYAAIWIAITLYAVLGGADFGAGIWEAVTWMRMGRKDRALLYGAIGPVWEANHVWLVFALVLTLTCFPPALGSIATLLWVPLLVATAGIVFRGSAFVFRSHGGQAAAEQHGWSAAFGLASTVTPLCFGAAAGAIAAGGLPASGTEALAPGAALTLLAPLPIVCALLAVSACAYLAAVYLTREAAAAHSKELVAAWRRRALAAGIVAGVLAAAGIVAMHASESVVWTRFRTRAWPIAAVSAGGAFLSIAALWRGRPTLAAASAAIAVAAVTLGWGVAQHPFLLPPLITTESHAPPDVLDAALWSAALGALVLAPSLLYLLRLFKAMPKA